VLSVGRRPGYGLAVELEHRDPSGLETTTLYAHLDAAIVAEGAPVRRGDVVGLSGGVGPGAGLSTGPHVHYEVRERTSGRGGSSARAVDPAVLYDRVRSWGAETVRQRRALTSAARALAARAQAEGGAPTTVSRTALLSDR
jgi:murein DD-endopeptidase MepM/ murein hydrolase activator NlpD